MIAGSLIFAAGFLAGAFVVACAWFAWCLWALFTDMEYTA